MHLSLVPIGSVFSSEVTRSDEICEMCSRPATPFIDTNAPYGLIAVTTPSTTWPISMSFISLSTTARRFETTIREFSLSTSRNLHGIFWPTMSSEAVRPTRWLPGRKARRPSMITTAPPRFTELTTVSNCASSARSASILFQASAYISRLRESCSWPFSSSLVITSNVYDLPSSKMVDRSSTCVRLASLFGTSAFDLVPMSTSAPEGCSRITRPVQLLPFVTRLVKPPIWLEKSE
mmetsp:Transcript_11168/g.35243  ORF Transcript_11168/g.35243 Transcript_11168/m.35243 type:complete len:235 (+) Transcript_11168:453-1157(+)